MLRSGGDRRGANIEEMLHNFGLRSTRQRFALASLLFMTADRCVTAEILYDAMHETRRPVSRATVFNTLRRFEQAGLVRRVAVHRSKKTWFGIASANAVISSS
jgi:Fur family transcriptional regulator, iron response regulator